MSFGPILHDFLFTDWLSARGLISEELSQLRAELNAQVGALLDNVSRGDIMVGNSTPVWSSLPIGAANTVLRTSGIDPAWGKVILTSDVSGILPVTNGGTGIALYTVGDLIYASGVSTLARLAAGPSGYVLTSNGAGVAPSWKQLPPIPIFFPEEGGGDDAMMIAPLSGVGTSGDGLGWSVLSNGDPAAPALVFDSNGDVIMTRPPL